LGETFAFLLLTLTATVLVSGCVIWNTSISRAQAMARGFYILSIVLSLATLSYILLGDSGVVRESDEFAPGASTVAVSGLARYRGGHQFGTSSSPKFGGEPEVRRR
jgi:hypothetical protein